MSQDLLEIDDLRTSFRSEDGEARVVDGVSLRVARGETLALVGESGCGKSVTSLSIVRLFASPPGRIEGGRILFRQRDGETVDLARTSERHLRQVRGAEIGMIFQEPMSSLNPLLTIGEQIAEGPRRHLGMGRREADRHAVAMLTQVGIATPERRARDYPHRLSGGMRQRAMIAVALACKPALLIADEPTTALDVTVQGQILELMRALQRELGMGMLFITHDLGVVAEIADRVAVMYAGRIVEQAAVADLFARPRHPYTQALLRSLPRIERTAKPERAPLEAIAGQVPTPLALPPGCAFAPRCALATDVCQAARPPLERTPDGQDVRCFRWREAA